MEQIEKLGDYLLGPNDTPENGIYTGDARVLAQAIPDESVDLVFTDPVYDRIDDYRWLAETAARVLREDRACLSWAATPWLPDILGAMIPPLEWAWMMNWQRTGPCYPGKPGICVLCECLWLQKGASRTYKKIADWAHWASGQGAKNNKHRWSKPEGLIFKWTQAFSLVDFVILDPFTGGGTVPAVCKMLGRQYLAFEIDPATADLARERVRNTQPPLFVPEPEQLAMEAL